MTKKVIVIILTVLSISLVLLGASKQSSGSKVDKRISLGNKYLKNGKYKQAIITFDKAISIQNKNVEARVGKGKAYIALGQNKRAEKILNEAISINSRTDEPYLVLADMYSDEEKFDEAIKILEKRDRIERSDKINEKADSIILIEESKKSYDDAIKQMGEKNYLDAVDNFKAVSKEDTKRYLDSQNMISQCEKLSTVGNLTLAGENIDNKKINEMNYVIENIFKIDTINP